jgi:hypothetical protein
MGFILRTAAAADVDALLALWREAAPRFMRNGAFALARTRAKAPLPT